LGAGCSDLRSLLAGLSGFGPDGACTGALSESCAACDGAATMAITKVSDASAQHGSRKAFTDTDLSAAAR
jgi:hypothetical protein